MDDDDNAQAVLVYLDGSRLNTNTFDLPLVYALEDKLEAAITRAGVGVFDGDEFGVQTPDATLYMYGPDAEALYRAVEPVLRSEPLCRGARVEIRAGGPDVDARVLRLPR